MVLMKDYPHFIGYFFLFNDKFMKNKLILSYFFVVLLTTSCAQTADTGIEMPENSSLTTEIVVDRLDIPWGLVFLPDGSMLISEKAGVLLHVKEGTRTEIGGLPEIGRIGQGGFLDLELHPDYANNGWLYFTYTSTEGEGSGGNTALMRAKIDGNQLVDQQLLYKATPNTQKGQHFGSRIEFDREGYLYFSVGDRGNREVNPQDITRDGGKIYRLHDDGRIPSDNPFVNEEGAKTAIYSYGHRNPQGLVLHPETGALWNHEHGPRGGDELNIIEKGKNYGWPVITYGINYSGTTITDETEREGMEQPQHYWVPSIAPSGMVFVSSDLYQGMKGDLLVGSLSFQYLEQLKMEGNKVARRIKLFEEIGRVRNVRQGPDGYIYMAVEGKGILRIVP